MNIIGKRKNHPIIKRPLLTNLTITSNVTTTLTQSNIQAKPSLSYQLNSPSSSSISSYEFQHQQILCASESKLLNQILQQNQTKELNERLSSLANEITTSGSQAFFNTVNRTNDNNINVVQQKLYKTGKETLQTESTSTNGSLSAAAVILMPQSKKYSTSSSASSSITVKFLLI